MNKTDSKTAKRARSQKDVRPEPFCQVVLHNDDVNSVEHVVKCLQTVFAHNMELAAKIMMEAHQKGRSIAEVEAQTPAIEHRDQLRSYGLSATVEPI
jgi:ATP-dependent Clp protease adaptor protein ClpS